MLKGLKSCVNHGVGSGSSCAQALQIFQITSLYLGPGGGQRLGTRIAARKS
jgi:hypothetical protein